MPGQKLTTADDSRLSYDEDTNAVRSFFGAELVSKPQGEMHGFNAVNADTPAEFNAENAENEALDFLSVNKEKFKLEGIDLKPTDVREGAAATSVRFEQRHDGVPVYGAELIIGFRTSDGQAVSAVNTVDYSIPDSMRKADVRLTAQDAIDVVVQTLEPECRTVSPHDPPDLFVYRHQAKHISPAPPNPSPFHKAMSERGTASDGKLYWVWRVRVETRAPDGDWKLLVDAIDGHIVAVCDRRRYATPKAYVFRPDPITSSKNPALTWADTLDNQRRVVRLRDLDPADAAGMCCLNGKWVKCVDFETPNFKPPSSSGDFMYDAKHDEFLFAMGYYWIHRFVKYLRKFEIKCLNDALVQVQIDPVACEEVDALGGVTQLDKSFFSLKGGVPSIAFGNGGIPDASDAHVIVHEYGHAVHHFLGCEPYCYDEGFCDFLAAVWLDRFNYHKFQRELVFPWDGNHAPWSLERRLDLTAKFSDANFASYDIYKVGNIWATALWNLFTSLGGAANQKLKTRIAAADTVIKLYLEMLHMVGIRPSREDLASGLLSADQSLNGGKGKYRQQICDAFAEKDTWENGPPPPI